MIDRIKLPGASPSLDREQSIKKQGESFQEKDKQFLESHIFGSFEQGMKGADLPEISEFQPHAIAVLSGGMARRILFKEQGKKLEHKLSPPSYSESDSHGKITGAKARFIAAKYLWKFLEYRPYFISTSGQSEELEGLTHARIGADYLQDVSPKIPEEQIILEQSSSDTISNLVEIINIARQQGWRRIAVLTNDYHMPRTKAFLKCLQNPGLLDQFLKYEKPKIQERIKLIAQKEKTIDSDKPLTQEAFVKFAAQLETIFIAAEDILKYHEQKHKKRHRSALIKEEIRRLIEMPKDGELSVQVFLKRMKRILKAKQKSSKLHYTTLLSEVQAGEDYYQRIKSEKRGWGDLLAGNYGKNKK